MRDDIDSFVAEHKPPRTSPSIWSRIGSLAMYTIVPPAVIASGCWLAFGVAATAPSFLCALGIDLIAGYCVNGYQAVKSERIRAELMKAQMEYERGHLVGVSCPQCGQRNIVPLDLSVDGFECDKCHTKNKLYYDFRAASVMDLNREDVMKAAQERLSKLDEKTQNAWDSMDEVLK